MIKVAQFQKGFQFVSNLKNKVPYHSAQDSDLTLLFGDLSQSEKLSEIKSPLRNYSFLEGKILLLTDYGRPEGK